MAAMTHADENASKHSPSVNMMAEGVSNGTLLMRMPQNTPSVNMMAEGVRNGTLLMRMPQNTHHL